MHQNFHNFFHNEQHRSCYTNIRHHFDTVRDTDNVRLMAFYSYSTPIAWKLNGDLLIRTNHRYSNTTSMHQGDLRSATPFGMKEIVLSYLSVENGFNIVQEAFTHVNYYIGQDKEALKRKEDRRNIMKLYGDIKEILDNRDVLSYDNEYTNLLLNSERIKRLEEILDKLQPLHDKAQEKEAKLIERRCHVDTPEEAARKEKERQKRAERLQRKLDSITDNKLELLKAIFKRNHPLHSNEIIKQAGRAYKNSGYSYVWINDNGIETSKNVALRLSIIRIAFDLFNKNLLLGTKVGPYVVNEITDEHIQIGCHKIPMWNINLLEEELKNIKEDEQ